MPTKPIICWLTMIVLWLTWTPTSESPPEFLVGPPDDLKDLLGNLILFWPIAAIIVAGTLGTQPATARDDGVSTDAVVKGAVLLIAVSSLVIELGQTKVLGRSVSLFDVVLNTGGGFVGALISVRLHRLGFAGWSFFGTVVGSVFMALLVFLSATGHTATGMLSLAGWNSDGYPVIAGSEVDGQSVYIGVVSDAQICGGRWSVEVCARPGADLLSRRSLTQAAVSSQRVRLTALVTSSDAQRGPARIVSFSRDSEQRNATLAQSGRDLLLRLRTPGAGPNGTNLVFLLEEAVPEGELTRVVADYRPGRVSVTAQTPGKSTENVYRWGYLSGWWLLSGGGGSFTPWRLILATALAAAALSLPIGLFAGVLAAAESRMRVGLALIGPMALVVAVTWPLGGPTPVHELLLCSLFGLLGLALSRLGAKATAIT